MVAYLTHALVHAMIDTTHLPPLPCYVSGDYTTLPEARISPLDRGFIFGDGVYEGISFYGRPGHTPRPFRFAQHMARLERSLAETRIPNPHTSQQWRQIATELIAKYPGVVSADGKNDAQPAPTDWFYYFQVTRGVALRDHPMLPGLTPTVFATCLPMKPPTPEAWPASRRTTSAGRRRTSSRSACWAPCSRGRSALSRARWRR